jgi:hypothetical protein
MDAVGLVAHARDHYIKQFRAFVEDQLAQCEQGAAEVKLQLGEQSDIFQRLYCVDFISNDGAARVIEFSPGDVLSFDPVTGHYGRSALVIRHLHWDDVLLRHDLEQVPEAALDAWFQRWFDPEDVRYEPDASISHVIHSLMVDPGLLSIDLGTASPEAFWEMVDLLEQANASMISVSSSREETEPRQAG